METTKPCCEERTAIQSGYPCNLRDLLQPRGRAIAALGVASAVCLFSLGCSRAPETYPMPPQVQLVTESPALSLVRSEIDLTKIEAFAQVVDGVHLKEPHWLPARWLHREAHIELLYDPAVHQELRVQGLVENPQLDLTGPITFRVLHGERLLMEQTLTRDIRFDFRSPLGTPLQAEKGIVSLHLMAGPGWKPEWSQDEFTFGLSKIGFASE